MLARTPTWPPDYHAVIAWRNQQLLTFQDKPHFVVAAREHYKDHPGDFINHWCITFDPRNALIDRPVKMPFVLFPRQNEMVEFLHDVLRAETGGLIEKCRDMGATWLCCAFSVWLLLFRPGASVGWGSRKADLVDTLGDPDSIFEKMRMLIRNLPPEFLPVGFDSKNHMTYMKIVNPENGSSITGESGDNIGRGGRKLIYFKDESAHYERPELIEAALTDNTRVQIDISSVNGLNNVFHRRREAGQDWHPKSELTRNKTQVFVMDWRDHPEKDEAWYNARRAKAQEEGLLHLFAQEVDRDYSAAVEGTIIPAEWIRSAIDAHILLGNHVKGWRDGGHAAALDVADTGGDTNALAVVEGVVLVRLEEWGERDTGATARRAIAAVASLAPVSLQYDCIGVGSGIKSEANRLRDEKVMPRKVRLIPWDAGSSPLRPDRRVVEGDRDSPLNKDFYHNLKAQGWWELRRRFERTHAMVTAFKAQQPLPRYKTDDLVSLSSSLRLLRKAEKELAQVQRRAPSGRMKLVVDKTPEGTKSPNLGDAIMMAFHPMVGIYDISNKWVG